MSGQRQARTGVKGPGQSSDELLGVAQVFLVTSVEILQDKAAEGVGDLLWSLCTAHTSTVEVRRAVGGSLLRIPWNLGRQSERSGCPAGVLAGVAGERGSERGANWCRVKERVTGRLGGCETGRGAVAGWVGSATGAAG